MADEIRYEPNDYTGRPLTTEGYAMAEPFGARFRRVSWGAIFAGVVVALVVNLTLNLLGISIGAATINPTEEVRPAEGLGVGAGIWFLVASVISLFAGGWAAARLAGTPDRTDAMLHGVVTWGLTTLFTFYLLTTAVGNIVGGTAALLSRAAGAMATDDGARARITESPRPAREAAVQALMAQRGLTRAEAEREIDQALGRLDEPEVAEAAAEGVSSGALWAFIGLILAGGAAIAGGVVGRPHEIVTRVPV
ncbi:MAG: hypothetical protein WD696_13830 [Bryobacteraceae bacterium]